MSTLTKSLAAAAAVTGSAFLALNYLVMENTMHGKRQTREESLSWQKEHYDISFYDTLEKDDYVISSYDGYRLQAELVKNPEPSERYIIITHGYTDNRNGMLKYMKIYLDLGFNCIIYDLRGHGENKPDFCTYSIREAQDLREVINDTYKRYGKNIRVGLHGESLGAASTVRSLMYHPDVDFAVADCAFADIENVLEGAVASRSMPKFTVKICSAMAKLKYGYSYSEMRPIDALAGNKIPILFIHGKDDDFILPENSAMMKAVTSGYSELHLIPGAKHANSVLTDPEAYAGYVKEFLKNIYDS